jgi:hypothetical protein
MKTGPNRRQFLEAALSSAAGLALGQDESQEARARRIPARFVGDAFERGHHWITPDPEKLHVDRREKTAVVIVGAGIAGVVAAWRLQSGGVDDFVLLELEDKAGGLARSGMMGATAVPFGAVTMAVPHAATSPAVMRFLEFGGVARRQVSFSPQVFDSGVWRTKDLELGPPYAYPAATLFAPDSRSFQATLDRSSVAEWLVSAKASRAVVLSAERWCLLRFGSRAADISSASFALDVGRRFRTGDGRALVVPGGLASALAPLLEKIGQRLLPGRVAVLVKSAESGAIVRAVNALDAVVTDYEAKAVVLAVPPFIASRISPALHQRQRLDVPATTPWLVTAVMVSRWPKGFDPEVPFRQCPDERASLILHAGRPPEAVIIHHRPFPSPAATPARMFLRDLDAEEARAWAFRELAPVFPDLPALATRVELFRIGHGATRPAPGFLTGIAPRLRAPMPPIYPCGADYTGLPCVEAAIEDGVRGAEEVLKSLGTLDRSWL